MQEMIKVMQLQKIKQFSPFGENSNCNAYNLWVYFVLCTIDQARVK
jgi:hypothetical protein